MGTLVIILLVVFALWYRYSQRGIRQYKTAGASSLKLMGEQAECVGISFEVSEVIPFLC